MLVALAIAAQVAAAAPVDTPPPPRPRPQAVEVSEWYERRLTLHRRLSYATVPLFAFQYMAGREIWEKGGGAPAWARNGHRVGATAIAGVFTANVVTGVWNYMDSRGVEEGRALRTIHGLSMLAATAGFTWAGAVLSEQAETDPDKRRLHRTVALTSIGITVTSGVLMRVLNR
ncbi:MAG TPA: hypothetical protein VFO66_07635 [Gemmatimonadaceae bacterium]|nr:hypothetical protein [Gemmatimonadaceae bacterium]